LTLLEQITFQMPALSCVDTLMYDVTAPYRALTAVVRHFHHSPFGAKDVESAARARKVLSARLAAITSSTEIAPAVETLKAVDLPAMHAQPMWMTMVAIVGRHAQAVELLRQSIKQDPLNPSPDGSLGNVLASAGRLDEAAAAYRHGLELNERSIFAYEGLTIIHASQGRFTEALAAAEKAHALAPWNATGIGMLAGCLQRAGDADRSQEVLRLLGDGHQFGAPIGFAIHHAINDETEAGAEWLEKAIAERDPRAIVFLVLPTGHVWRRSARWPTLAKTLNLASAVA
jgi:tetratricopeptide (TPR) repeat protein